MLSLPYGFPSTVRRSGHAACWCPPLGGLVQFGGWPPSAELASTIRQDGSSCPLYVLTAEELVRGVERVRQAGAAGGSVSELCAEEGADGRRAASAMLGAAAGGSRAACGRAVSSESTHLRGRRPRRRVWMLQGGAYQGHGPCGSEGACDAPATHPPVAAQAQVGQVRAVGAHGGGPSAGVSHGFDRGSEDEGAGDSAAPSVHYEDGYHSEPSVFAESEVAEGGAAVAAAVNNPPSTSSSLSSEMGEARPGADGDAIVAPVVTMELLRALGGEGGGGPAAAAPALSVSAGAGVDTVSAAGTAPSTGVASALPAVLLASRRALDGGGGGFHEASPIPRGVAHVPGKSSTRPLRWRARREVVAPRTRHGHHLVYHDGRLYVIGGCYWAHGNALATSDMCYHVAQRRWRQLEPLFPPRFCAALAEGNARVEHEVVDEPQGSDGHTFQIPSLLRGPTLDAAAATAATADPPGKVLYAFGGVDVTQTPTATLHRVWLPCGAQQELPQYGATPRPQFKGMLVADVVRERSVEAVRRGARTLGRLFLLDGFPEGRPMAPALRYYTLATGFWVRVCSCPDLIRGQIAGAWRSCAPPADAAYLQRHSHLGAAAAANDAPTPVTAGSTVKGLGGDGRGSSGSGGRSEEVTEEGAEGAGHGHGPAPTYLHRFDVFGGMPSRRGKQRRSRVCYSFDVDRQCFDFANPLPVPGLTAHVVVPLPNTDADRRDGEAGDDAASDRWLRVLRGTFGISAVSCGGNEDLNDLEQNSLGEPVSWVYLFAPREIPLAEQVRVYLDSNRIPLKLVLAPKKDELLDELF